MTWDPEILHAEIAREFAADAVQDRVIERAYERYQRQLARTRRVRQEEKIFLRRKQPPIAPLPCERTCPTCGRGFVTEQSLGAHRARSHA